MSAISSMFLPMTSPEPPGKRDCEWVSALLRRLAEADAGRLGLVRTLATADLWRIWRGTKHCSTARDRGTHETMGLELRRRGHLDSAGQPRSQSPAGQDRPDVA